MLVKMGGFGQLIDMMCDYDCTEKQLSGGVRTKFHITQRNIKLLYIFLR